MNLLIVVNPISGGGRGRRRLPALLETLKSRGVTADVVETQRSGDARRAAAAVDGTVDAVVSIGGDGTTNEILNGLPRLDAVALGVFPSGTANILARELRLPFDPRRAGEMLARLRTRPFDVGVATAADGAPRRFLMCASVGWDAEVLRHLETARRGPISRASYVLPAARAAFGYAFPEAQVRIDGRDEGPANLVFVGNGRNYAAYFSFTPHARFDDGALDVTLIRSDRPRDVVRWFVGALVGRLPRYSEVRMRRGRKIEIVGDAPVPFQVDGDSAGNTPVALGVRPAAARLVVEETT